MTRTKEEALRLGIRICPTKHSQKRRAVWNDYYKPGCYGMTIHIFEYEDGSYEKAALLSEVKGRCWRESPLLSSAEEQCPPYVELTDLGRLVQAKIDGIGTHRYEEGVIVRNSVIMPSHVHLTIEITRELPVIQRGKNRERYHLGRIIGYVKSGTTGWYRRLLQGETVEEILAAPNWRDIYNEDGTRKEGKSTPLSSAGDITLWDANYNDKILNTQQKYDEWTRYVDMNPFRWRMRDERPDLFEHRLHLMVEGTDYSAWGCMFLLRKPDRIQVFCHRYKMDATERYRQKDANGNWIPYTSTPEFEQQKDNVLMAVREGAVVVSPGVSPGEAAIVEAALEAGGEVIKLYKDPLTKKSHPRGTDIDHCAQGQMLVLGPWEIPDANAFEQRFGDADSQYAQFHNLNDLAKRLCEPLNEVVLKEVCEK